MDARRRGLVVVAEDEAPIADIIRRHLERAGYAVHQEGDGDRVEAAVTSLRPDAVVLDIGLPGRDGIDICRRLRAGQNWVPIVFLTARDDEVDRIIGIELGADDYLTKPFSPRELVARIGAVLRRTRQTTDLPDRFRLGSVEVDKSARRAYVHDAEITLTATEFALLSFLVEHPARVFSRAQLLDHVWGYGSDAGSRTVDVHVAQLRSKLGDADVLRTVRGVGYSAEVNKR